MRDVGLRDGYDWNAAAGKIEDFLGDRFHADLVSCAFTVRVNTSPGANTPAIEVHIPGLEEFDFVFTAGYVAGMLGWYRLGTMTMTDGASSFRLAGPE